MTEPGKLVPGVLTPIPGHPGSYSYRVIVSQRAGNARIPIGRRKALGKKLATSILVGQIAHVMLRVFYFAWALVALIFLRDILWARFVFAVTAMGLGCNCLVIMSNGGRMPVQVPPTDFSA